MLVSVGIFLFLLYFLYVRWYLHIKEIFLNYNAQTFLGSLYMATDLRILCGDFYPYVP